MDNIQDTHYHPRTPHQHTALITTLLDCAQACEQGMSAALNEEATALMAHCIALQRDCSELCFMGAKLLIREADISHPFLLICEEICNQCAAECGRHEHQYCKESSEACKRCADACHEHYGQVVKARNDAGESPASIH